jgi:hypothetical protein
MIGLFVMKRSAVIDEYTTCATFECIGVSWRRCGFQAR